jgi:hypothetical protein
MRSIMERTIRGEFLCPFPVPGAVKVKVRFPDHQINETISLSPDEARRLGTSLIEQACAAERSDMRDAHTMAYAGEKQAQGYEAGANPPHLY